MRIDVDAFINRFSYTNKNLHSALNLTAFRSEVGRSFFIPAMYNFENYFRNKWFF